MPNLSASDQPTVSVVIPYFEQQRQLDLVLTALTMQSYPADRLQVVIADDGSAKAPNVDAAVVDAGARALDVTVVRQADRGFRAAAARNLGVSASDGSVLCFLDADTIPEPNYISRAVHLPSLLPDALVVGRRRHANFESWTGTELQNWFADSQESSEPILLSEPQWLRDAYAGSNDLLDVDSRSYRYVISAVMTCSRELFEAAGGFDEGFVEYGGEDWEFAHRAFEAGAVFAHAATAVAWHDGPEWAERTGGDRSRKNGEAMALAARITDPAARTHGLIFGIPEITAVVDTSGHSAASLLLTVGSLLRSGDCRVWIDGPQAESLRRQWGDVDPRIHLGSPPDTDRARCVVRVVGPVVFEERALRSVLDTGADRITIVVGDDSTVTVRSARSTARSQRWSAALGTNAEKVADSLFGHIELRGSDVGMTRGEDDPALSW